MSLESLLVKGEKDFSRVQNPKFSRRSFLETGGAGLLGLLGNLVLPKNARGNGVLIKPKNLFFTGIEYGISNITSTNIWQLQFQMPDFINMDYIQFIF